MYSKTVIFESLPNFKPYNEGVLAATMSLCFWVSGLATSVSHSFMYDTSSALSRDHYVHMTLRGLHCWNSIRRMSYE